MQIGSRADRTPLNGKGPRQTRHGGDAAVTIALMQTSGTRFAAGSRSRIHRAAEPDSVGRLRQVCTCEQFTPTLATYAWLEEHDHERKPSANRHTSASTWLRSGTSYARQSRQDRRPDGGARASCSEPIHRSTRSRAEREIAARGLDRRVLGAILSSRSRLCPSTSRAATSTTRRHTRTTRSPPASQRQMPLRPVRCTPPSHRSIPHASTRSSRPARTVRPASVRITLRSNGRRSAPAGMSSARRGGDVRESASAIPANDRSVR